MTIWGCKTGLVKDDSGNPETREKLLTRFPDAVEMERRPGRYEEYIHGTGYVNTQTPEQLAAAQLAEAKKKERTDNILAGLTFEQAENWIDENVVLTNPSSVKTAFKHIARLLIALR